MFVNASSPLSTDQVDAIVHLVAAAYPGLTTDNVSVVDQKGDTLSSVGGGTAGSGTTSTAAGNGSKLGGTLGDQLQRRVSYGLQKVALWYCAWRLFLPR